MKRSLFSLVMVCVCVLAWYIVVEVGIVVPEVNEKNYIPRDITPQYQWAAESIDYMLSAEIMTLDEADNFLPNNKITKAELAKMLVTAFEIPIVENIMQIYPDVPSSHWAYSYINAADKYIYTGGTLFQPDEILTREAVVHSLIRAKAYDGLVADIAIISVFADYDSIIEELRKDMTIAYLKGIIQADGNQLHPKREVTRAEMAVMLHRLLQGEAEYTETRIVGMTKVAVEVARMWAQERGAAQRFIDVADLYWEYGEKTGIRADIMYAQAAKETAFGNYTGNVTPGMNNWAGIKVIDASGDKPEDHESFATVDDGVRAHYNHMAAYVGLAPLGAVHDRYNIVITTDWAGNIESVEDLSGRWAPDVNYGNSIVNDYLRDMQRYI